MSIKKTLQEKRAKVELTDEIVRNCLCNTDTFDEYKNLAADGGIEGVKDAAHLEKIIHKVDTHLIEVRWKGSVNKYRLKDPIPKKNGADLPNGKPLPTLEQVKRANWRPKKKDALDYRVPGHFEDNK